LPTRSPRRWCGYCSRRAPREWENVRAFRILFSSGDEAVLLATVAPSLAGALRYSTDGELLPSFFTVQHPRLHTVRADEVLSCVEIEAPRVPPPRSRRRPSRRRKRRRSL
jgi:hypothetical protein